MGVTLVPAVAARLQERAARSGLNEDDMANALLATALDLEGLGSEDEVAAISEGLRACDEGRERRFSEFISEHKSKYPASES